MLRLRISAATRPTFLRIPRILQSPTGNSRFSMTSRRAEENAQPIASTRRGYPWLTTFGGVVLFGAGYCVGVLHTKQKIKAMARSGIQGGAQIAGGIVGGIKKWWKGGKETKIADDVVKDKKDEEEIAKTAHREPPEPLVNEERQREKAWFTKHKQDISKDKATSSRFVKDDPKKNQAGGRGV